MRLLDGLRRLAAADPAVRATAAEALGAAGDARAVDPLARTVDHDPDPAVRIAAATALGAYPTEAAEVALALALGNNKRSLDERGAAADALGRHGTQAAALGLWKARGEPGAELHGRVLGVLAAAYPDQLAAFEAQTPTLDRTGRVWLVPVMALHGGFFMTALADVAGGEPGGLSFLGGAAVGGVTPWLLTLRSEVSAASGFWIDSTTTWGFASGGFTAMAADLDQDDSLLTLIGGQAAGLAAGLLTHDRIPYSAGDVGYINGAAYTGMLAGFGATVLADVDRMQDAAPALQAGLVAGGVAGALLTERLTLTPGDSALLVANTLSGMWIGGWLPLVLLDDGYKDDHVGGGVLIGAGVGYAAGTLLSQQLDLAPADVFETSVAGTWGTFVGLGTAMMLSTGEGSPRALGALVLGGGAAGVTAASLTARDTEYSEGDLLTVISGMGWGLWQGAGLGSLAFDRGTNRTGATLFGLGAGGAAGAVIAQMTSPTPLDVGMALSGGVWGGWLAGWAAYVAQKRSDSVDDDDVLLATLLGSDAGLALAAVALSPLLDVPPERLGWVNAAGILGMGVGTSVAAVVSDQVAEGNLAGSALGLGAGVVLTSFMNFDAPAPAAGPAAALRPALLPDAWFPTLLVTPEESGGTRLVAGIAGLL